MAADRLAIPRAARVRYFHLRNRHSRCGLDFVRQGEADGDGGGEQGDVFFMACTSIVWVDVYYMFNIMAKLLSFVNPAYQVFTAD